METYNPYYPYGYNYPVPPSLQPKPEQAPVVKGKEALVNYPMAANSSKLFLDESGDILWFVTTDSAAYKTIKAYDIYDHIEPEVAAQAQTNDILVSIDQRLQKVEAFMNELNSQSTSSERYKQSNSPKPNNSQNRRQEQPRGPEQSG